MAPTTIMASRAIMRGPNMLLPHQLVLFGIGLLESFEQLGLFDEVPRALGELRHGTASGAIADQQEYIGVFARDIVGENYLGDDGGPFQGDHQGYVGDAARNDV